jgi:choline dehydrogenase
MVGSGRPHSRGWVLLRTIDPTAHPRIFPEYFSAPDDLRALARSVRRMRDMMRERPIRALIEAELTPGPIANDQAAIEEDIRAAKECIERRFTRPRRSWRRPPHQS